MFLSAPVEAVIAVSTLDQAARDPKALRDDSFMEVQATTTLMAATTVLQEAKAARARAPVEALTVKVVHPTNPTLLLANGKLSVPMVIMTTTVLVVMIMTTTVPVARTALDHTVRLVPRVDQRADQRELVDQVLMDLARALLAPMDLAQALLAPTVLAQALLAPTVLAQALPVLTVPAQVLQAPTDQVPPREPGEDRTDQALMDQVLPRELPREQVEDRTVAAEATVEAVEVAPTEVEAPTSLTTALLWNVGLNVHATLS